VAHDRADRSDGGGVMGVMMDTVFIKGLKVASVIGCYDWERDIRQTLVIDLELKADFTRAVQTDALDDALDYAAIAQRVIAACDAARFQLLEALADPSGENAVSRICDCRPAHDHYQARRGTRGRGCRRGD